MIPRHIKFQIDQYLESGISPSGFLGEVLRNDLITAIQKADDTNKVHIPDIVIYLLNYAPIGSYGSAKDVKDWLQAHRDGEDWVKESIARDRTRRKVYYEGRRTPR